MYLKGSNIVLSNYDQDDAATEERIAQILCEAQAAMQMKQTDRNAVRLVNV